MQQLLNFSIDCFNLIKLFFFYKMSKIAVTRSHNYVIMQLISSKTKVGYSMMNGIKIKIKLCISSKLLVFLYI